LSAAKICSKQYTSAVLDSFLRRRSLHTLLPSGEAIFLHRPHGYPCHGITREVVADFDQLSRLLLQNRERRRYAVPREITLVTYNNCARKSLIERCYEAHGIEGAVVLGREAARWDWSLKVKLVLDYLESGACTTPYLVVTDADDVLLASDPEPLLDRFRSYGCDVLFCNTFVDWPPNRQYRDFETLLYYAYPFHCHLSAGGYVAEKDALKRLLRELRDAYERKETWALVGDVFDDQLAWRRLHHDRHPAIQVDCASRVFKRYDVFRNVTE
jgi:hypothetical protein